LDTTALAERLPRHAGRSPGNALRVLDADPVAFRQCFGRLPTIFRHNLPSTGLFTIDRLTAIAERMIAMGRADGMVMHEDSRTPAGNIIVKRKKPVASALSRLDTTSWRIIFFRVNEYDHELDDVYREILGDLDTLLERRIVKDPRLSHMNVFVASPHMITPYHFDHGHNFLFQIVSDKSAWLWDPNDRVNLPDAEIEDFYLEAWDRPRNEPDFGRAREFRLRPGDVLHHASLAPHWVETGPSVSISVTIQFSTAALERRARIYQVNGMLRRVGLTPPPPDASRVLDTLRSGMMGVLAKRSPENQGEAVWAGLRRLKKWRKRLSNYRG
jgi:hypothetical protein